MPADADESSWKMPRKRYSLTHPMLAVTSACDVAGTATAERTRAGTRFLIFMRVLLLIARKDVETRGPLQNACHGAQTFPNRELRENALSACEQSAPWW